MVHFTLIRVELRCAYNFSKYQAGVETIYGGTVPPLPVMIYDGGFLMKVVNSYLVDTRPCFSVYKTSIRRRQHCIDILQTLKQRRASSG